jgi:hypothetical protein
MEQHRFSIGKNNQGDPSPDNQPGYSGRNAPAPSFEAQAHFVERLNELIAEHDDLDLAVASLLSTGCCDDLVISRLKKRKLYLKDEISRAQVDLPGSAESAA